MKFYSTKNKSLRVTLKDAVLQGLAVDGGLFVPETLPRLPADVIEALPAMSFREIAFTLAKSFADELPNSALQNIIDEALTFEVPLRRLGENLFVLELFHGPTLAFKDFGARFMARLMGWLRRHETKELVILVATSGDTGSAVASGFFNRPGFRVVLLYPSGMVSEIQEKQLTTIGGNVTAVEVQGTFDDCQRLVKQAFTDAQLRQTLALSSANSINIARLIPQMFYYAAAWAQLNDVTARPVVSVPSGNLGNLTAGLWAQKSGIPIERFVAAMNANDVFFEYLQKGLYMPRKAVPTLSNAMDVGNPSNFFRILDLFDYNYARICDHIYGARFTDDETRQAIAEIWQKHAYLMDPHGAVGYLALDEFQRKESAAGRPAIVLETAHPAKFKEVVEECSGQRVPVPERLQKALAGEKQAVVLSNRFDEFKQWLMG
jgi:threonine synthase